MITDKEKVGLIYVVENIINSKKYIGATSLGLSVRKQQHEKIAENGKTKYYIHRAINKYGKENFIWFVLEDNVPLSIMFEREKYFIEKYNTFDSGYNITLGGEGVVGNILSEESKRKIGLASKGRKVSEKTKRKISESSKGKKKSKETIKKMKAYQSNRTLPPECIERFAKVNAESIWIHKGEEEKRIQKENFHLFPDWERGRGWTEEQLKAISKVHKGKLVSEETKEKMRKAKQKTLERRNI